MTTLIQTEPSWGINDGEIGIDRDMGRTSFPECHEIVVIGSL
jgi:hypothetical protein